MFTDTHCHLFTTDYEDIPKILKDAKELKIHRVINNGTNLETNKEVLTMIKNYPNMFGAIGFHPDSIEEYTKENMQFLKKHIDEVVAIGEIGLDYHYEGFDKEKQKSLFMAQLEIAKKYHKPVIVHSRDATDDTINILKKFPEVTGSIHCFSGSLETAKIYIKMGYKLGFGGVTTFKNAKIKEVIKNIPLESILLETDSPYLSPEPFRGTKNEPKNVYFIAKFICELKGLSLEELSKITERNVHNIFDI